MNSRATETPASRAMRSEPDARLDLLRPGDIPFCRVVLAQSPHGQAEAIERIGILRIEFDRRVVIGIREIVMARALMDIAAIDERDRISRSAGRADRKPVNPWD